MYQLCQTRKYFKRLPISFSFCAPMRWFDYHKFIDLSLVLYVFLFVRIIVFVVVNFLNEQIKKNILGDGNNSDQQSMLTEKKLICIKQFAIEPNFKKKCLKKRFVRKRQLSTYSFVFYSISNLYLIAVLERGMLVLLLFSVVDIASTKIHLQCIANLCFT